MRWRFFARRLVTLPATRNKTAVSAPLLQTYVMPPKITVANRSHTSFPEIAQGWVFSPIGGMELALARGGLVLDDIERRTDGMASFQETLRRLAIAFV